MSKKTTLTEYGDFECPNCLEAYPVVKQLRQELGNKLTFEWKNFPISESHPHAVHAAHAAEAARLQNKFDAMHDMLFENQDHQEDDDLLLYAKKLTLDIDKFIADFESQRIADIVKRDFLTGAKKGVNGTPTFFINDKRWDGPYDYDSLTEAISNA